MAKYKPKKAPGVYVFGVWKAPAWCYSHSSSGVDGSSFAGLAFYHHPKCPRDRVKRDKLISVTCPCGITIDLDPEKIGLEDIKMPCPDPKHFAVKYEETQ